MIEAGAVAFSAHRQPFFRGMSHCEPLFAAIQSSWSSETSADVSWTSENPELGQCAVTACVVEEQLGGEVVWGMARLPDGSEVSHYWNRLPDGTELDLTRSQFPAGTVIPSGAAKLQSTSGQTFISTRAYVLSFEATSRRYAALRAAVDQTLGERPSASTIFP